MLKDILVFLLLVLSKASCKEISNTTTVIKNDTSSIRVYDEEILVGVDNAGDLNKGVAHLLSPLREMGLGFVVYHYYPENSLSDQVASINYIGKFFDKNQIRFILNTEISNNRTSIIDNDRWDWCNGPANTHRFTFKPEILKLLNQYNMFDGVMYDEPAHMQLNRSWIYENNAKVDRPFLGETTGKTFEEADNLVYTNAHALVQELKSYKTPYVLGEHVFPVLFHNFSRAGITPVYKQLKESWAPMWAACAMGAALQYGTELWTCLDLWFAGVPGNSPMYPGHSPGELKSNLIYSYWVGNDRVYIENLNYNNSLYSTEGDRIVLNDYGKAVKWFTHEYLPANTRGYTYRDLKPDIAIIRFDDTDFGIANKNGFPDQLFGSKTLQSTGKTREWMKIWNVISHGVIPTPENGISWLSYPLGTPHKSFAPMNNVVVFDHTVSQKHLEFLKLAFLSGIKISERTLEALTRLVDQKGLVVVSVPDLAPAEIRSAYSGSGTQLINSGDTGGYWILTDDFLDPVIKNKINHLLGNSNEMRYVFKSKEIIMTIGPNDEIAIKLNTME